MRVLCINFTYVVRSFRVEGALYVWELDLLEFFELFYQQGLIRRRLNLNLILVGEKTKRINFLAKPKI